MNLLHPSARYIIRKQLDEADLIVLNKVDQIPASDLRKLQDELQNQYPRTRSLAMCALHGGILGWLEWMQQPGPTGERIADVDYDVYAEGEAVLGWLNATASLFPKETVDWNDWSLKLLDALQRSLSGRSAEIAHVKMLMVSASMQSLSANLTSSEGRASVRGQITGDSPITLVFNARVQIAPVELRTVIEEHLGAACGEVIQFKIDAIQSLSPGRPQPLHRYATAV